MSNGGTVKTFSDKPMAVENEPYIPVQVKYVEAHTATVKQNTRTPNLPTIRTTAPEEAPDLKINLEQAPANHVELTVESLHSPAISPTCESPNNAMTPNEFQYDPNLSYAEKVAYEMIITEKMYLENLKQIIDGFLDPVTNHPDLGVSQENIDDLFINVEEIYNFNWVLLKDMEECDYNPVKLAECFVVKQIGFDVYTRYCTHYPRSMEVLLEWTQREDTANFIKHQQEALGHTLPLCSFLLKPVQRILKYHLLLGNIAKHYKQSEDEEGFEIIQKALSAMTNVAKHINDMKRIHEDAVHLQEIQSVLMDYEGPNLTSFGRLVLEETFRLHGTRTGRYLFLFEKSLLITKRRSDGTFTWKATVMGKRRISLCSPPCEQRLAYVEGLIDESMGQINVQDIVNSCQHAHRFFQRALNLEDMEFSNMMLADSVFREPLTFQVIPFDDKKMCHTFVSRNMDTKRVWLLELKRRLLDSYAAAVPMKVKQIILGNGIEDCEKENAEPDSGRKSAATSTARKGENQQRTHSSKDNSAQSTKLPKVVENDHRKSKDSEEILEENAYAALMASIKSPLRRKLRVFKKRKFSKDQGKHSKRVSWSSDDNNDEQYPENELLSPCEDVEELETETNGEVDDTSTEKSDAQLMETNTEGENVKKNDALIEPPTNNDTVSVQEGDSLQSLDPVKPLPDIKEESVPVKKRRLAKEDREKIKSMPAGELLAKAFEALVKTRSYSLSELDEKSKPCLQLSAPVPDRDLQDRHGLVNLRENAAVIRTRRLGSNDEPTAPAGGYLRRNQGIDNLHTDDNSISTMADETSVTQTMRCVSAAFSDISANFSRDETPASSTEDLTEDFTGQLDEESDDLGAFPEQQDTYWDKEEDVLASERETKTEDLEEGGNRSTIWDRIEVTGENASASPPNEDDEDMSMHDLESNEDKISILYSGRSSYADTFSDSYDDQDEELSSPSKHLDGTYQKVFSLNRSLSEENLISKFAIDDTVTECASCPDAVIASKGCSHVEHKRTPVTRSKSIGSPWSSLKPFTFSVTPKKKIVIKDSLWETIKEDSEDDAVDLLENSERSVRRRKKRRNHKSEKNAKKCPDEEEVEKVARNLQPVTCNIQPVTSYASLDIGDYRKSGVDGDTNCVDIDECSSGTQKDDDDDTATASSHSISSADTSEAGHEEKEIVTKVEVALRRPKHTKRTREKSLLHVDANVSQVPPSINYLCIEIAPDETASKVDSGAGDRDGKCNDDSRVGRLSKYFNEAKAEDTNTTKYTSTDTLQHASNIKQRVEELKRKEWSSEKPVVKDELNSLRNIKDRIDVLKRSTAEETPTTSKIKPETRNSLVNVRSRAAANVKRLTNRIEEIASTEPLQTEANCQVNKDLRNQLQASLQIKDGMNDLEKNIDGRLRGWRRIKDRIDKLQNEKNEKPQREVDRDITISDGNEMTEILSSPQKNEELKTVVIKRGWVQQFVQKIETGS